MAVYGGVFLIGIFWILSMRRHVEAKSTLIAARRRYVAVMAVTIAVVAALDIAAGVYAGSAVLDWIWASFFAVLA